MLVISDAFVYAWEYSGNSTYLEIAEQQFRDGSRWFWFEGNPEGQFATGKQHAILSTSGFKYSYLLYESYASNSGGGDTALEEAHFQIGGGALNRVAPRIYG